MDPRQLQLQFSSLPPPKACCHCKTGTESLQCSCDSTLVSSQSHFHVPSHLHVPYMLLPQPGHQLVCRCPVSGAVLERVLESARKSARKGISLINIYVYIYICMYMYIYINVSQLYPYKSLLLQLKTNIYRGKTLVSLHFRPETSQDTSRLPRTRSSLLHLPTELTCKKIGF